MMAVVAKRKPEAISNSEDDGAVASAGQKKPKSVTSDPAKKRRTSLPTSQPVQKNTLDNWFGIAKQTAKTEKKQSIDDGDGDEGDASGDALPVVRVPRRRVSTSASPSVNKEKGKKLVQRRILLSDQCRVCESSKTETSSRCERKCMECEMTVHMSCYGVDEDDETLPEKWRCRPCQATFDLSEEKPEHHCEEEEETTEKGIPVHDIRGTGNRFDGLYHSSDFAAVFLFLKRFRRLGLKLGADITVDTLATALLAPREHTLLQELHTRLLQNISATISKNGNWVDNVIRFLKANDYTICGELVRRLAACGNANDWLETYYDVPVADRVAILKVLCEAQFDKNDMLVEKLGHADTSPESLREEILGVDACKRTYYLLEDPSNFADGSAWLCRCQSVDGSSWETVSDDLTSLQSFVRALSFSTETLDLQLWQTIASGVAKSLERREKKKLQQAERLARVPRMLRSTGLDMSSILPEDGLSSSTGRSLRTRKAVSYRSYESEDDLDDESDAEDQDDDDEDDDEEQDDVDDDDGGARNRSRRRPAPQPTRSSRRLRGSPQRDNEEISGDEDHDAESDASDNAGTRHEEEEEEDEQDGESDDSD